MEPARTAAGPNRHERFEALYAAHYEAILAYVLRRAGAEAAGDVVADTFLVAWRRLDNVPADALPWLYGVARRSLANERRRRSRRDALTGDPGDLAVSPSDEAISLSEITAALRRLRDEDQEVLRLAAWEGLDARAIAAVLGCSVTAARVRLHRARRRLRSQLDDEEAVGAPPAINLEEAAR